MRPFFVTIAAGVAIVASFVYWVDPAFQWHRQAYPTEELHDGESWTWPRPDINQFVAKTQVAKNTATRDVVVFGSSRILHPETTWLSRSVTRSNLAMGFNTVGKTAALWAALKESGRKPRYIVWALDPWALRQAWASQFPVPQPKRMTPALTLRELLNRQSFVASLKMTFRPDPPKFFYRADGTLGRFQAQRGNRSAGEGLSGLEKLLWPWEVSGDDLHLAASLLQDWHQNGIEVIVLHLPYQPHTFKKLQADRRLTSALREANNELRRLAESAGAAFCDQSDPRSAGCKDVEFEDPLHPTAACMQKVARACFERLPTWRRLIEP